MSRQGRVLDGNTLIWTAFNRKYDLGHANWSMERETSREMQCRCHNPTMIGPVSHHKSHSLSIISRQLSDSERRVVKFPRKCTNSFAVYGWIYGISSVGMFSIILASKGHVQSSSAGRQWKNLSHYFRAYFCGTRLSQHWLAHWSEVAEKTTIGEEVIRWLDRLSHCSSGRVVNARDIVRISNLIQIGVW